MGRGVKFRRGSQVAGQMAGHPVDGWNEGRFVRVRLLAAAPLAVAVFYSDVMRPAAGTSRNDASH